MEITLNTTFQNEFVDHGSELGFEGNSSDPSERWERSAPLAAEVVNDWVMGAAIENLAIRGHVAAGVNFRL